MVAGEDQRLNGLIASGPAFNQMPWQSQLEWVPLAAGQVLQEAGQPIEEVIFPITALVALVLGLQDGASAAVALVGREGLVGVSTFMGGSSTLYRAEVMCAGHGLRLRAQALQQAFDHCEVTRQQLLQYTQALITQVAQTVVCNRHHRLEQRLSRLLLLSLDRLKGPTVTITHETMAQLLCTRREGVTEAVQALRASGLILCERGRITVQDRAGLERHTCECHSVVAREYARLLQPASLSGLPFGPAVIQPGMARRSVLPAAERAEPVGVHLMR